MLELKCSCGFSKKFYTSKEHKHPDQQRVRGFDINKRIVYGMC